MSSTNNELIHTNVDKSEQNVPKKRPNIIIIIISIPFVLLFYYPFKFINHLYDQIIRNMLVQLWNGLKFVYLKVKFGMKFIFDWTAWIAEKIKCGVLLSIKFIENHFTHFWDALCKSVMKLITKIEKLVTGLQNVIISVYENLIKLILNRIIIPIKNMIKQTFITLYNATAAL